jgi:hypothetical protein
VREILERVQNTIWGAIRNLFGRLRALFRPGAAASGAEAADNRTPQQKQTDLSQAIAAGTRLIAQPGATEEGVRAQLATLKTQHRLAVLDLIVDSRQGQQETVHIHGEVNPTDDSAPSVIGAVASDLVVGGYLGMKATVGRSGRHGGTQGSVAGEQWKALQIIKIEGNLITLRPVVGHNDYVVGLATVTNDVNGPMRLYKRISGPDELAEHGIYVDRGMLKPEFRGNGPIRSLFYLGDYAAAHADTLRSRAKQGVHAHPDFAGGKPTGGAWGPDAWVCPGFNRPSHIVEGGGTVDHKTPVAEHWSNLGGNNTDQGKRREWNTGIGNLELLCGPCNSSKGSIGSGGTRISYLDSVGDEFKGPDGKR